MAMSKWIRLTAEEVATVRALSRSEPVENVSEIMAGIYEKAKIKRPPPLPPIDPELGKRFRKYRKSHGIGLEEFSKHINYAPVTICQWESGYSRLRRDAVDGLAQMLNIAPEEIAKEIEYNEYLFTGKHE